MNEEIAYEIRIEESGNVSVKDCNQFSSKISDFAKPLPTYKSKIVSEFASVYAHELMKESLEDLIGKDLERIKNLRI